MSPVLFSLLLLFFSHKIYGNCPEGAIEGNNPNDCYYFFLEQLNWAAAERNCQRIQGHLTSITNTFQNYLLLSEITEVWMNLVASVWTGGNTQPDIGAWSWSDGTPFVYQNWAIGQPSGYQGLCAEISAADGKWYSVDCETTLPFICKVNATSYVTPTTTIPTTRKTTTHTPECPSDYTYFNQTNSCYKFYSLQSFIFNNSEALCVSDGGHLASIHSEAENNFIGTIGDATMAWIGVLYQDGGWTWTDGTRYDYSKWYSEGDSNSPCGAYDASSSDSDYLQWYGTDCSDTDYGGLVCKISLN